MAYSGFPIHFLDSRGRPVCGMLGKLYDGFYKVRFAKSCIDLSEAMVLRVLQANHEHLTALTQASGLARYFVTSSTGELKESFIPMKNKVQSRVFGSDFITGYAAFLTGLPGPLAVMINVSAERRVNVEGAFRLPDMTNFIREFATDSSVAAQRHNTKYYIQVPMIVAERGLIAGLVDNYKKLLPQPNNSLPIQLFMFGGAQVYQGDGPADAPRGVAAVALGPRAPPALAATPPAPRAKGPHVSYRDLRDAPADWRDCVARTSGPIEDPPEIVRISKPRSEAPDAMVARFAPPMRAGGSSDYVARAPEAACMFLQRGRVNDATAFGMPPLAKPCDDRRGLLPGAFAAVLQGTWLNTPEEQRYRASTVFGIEERLRTPFGQNLLKCLPPETHSSIAETIYVRTNGCCVTDDMIGAIVSGLVNDAKCERLAKGLKRAHDAALQADAELDGLLERAGQFSAMGVVGDQVRLIAASRTGMAGKAARIEARWQAPARTCGTSDVVARPDVVHPWREEVTRQALQDAVARWPSVRPEARAPVQATAAQATSASALPSTRAPRKDYAEEKDSEDETEAEEDPDDLYS